MLKSSFSRHEFRDEEQARGSHGKQAGLLLPVTVLVGSGKWKMANRTNQETGWMK